MPRLESTPRGQCERHDGSGAGHSPPSAHRPHARGDHRGRPRRLRRARLPVDVASRRSPRPPASVTPACCATSRRRASCSPRSWRRSSARTRSICSDARRPTIRAPRFGAMARRNGSVPGYLELFAALTGEASTPLHPAHAIMREQVRPAHRALGRHPAGGRSTTASSRPTAIARDEAIRLAAAWDGLQLLTQYLPERVDVGAALDAREELLGLPRGWRDPDDRRRTGPPASFLALPDLGSRPSRRRKRGTAWAATGEPGSSRTRWRCSPATGTATRVCRASREAVGVSKSTLLHHYPSKEALLSAVLAERDRGIRMLETAPAARARRRRAARDPPGSRAQRANGAGAHRGVRDPLVRGGAGRASGPCVLHRPLRERRSTTSPRCCAPRRPMATSPAHRDPALRGALARRPVGRTAVPVALRPARASTSPRTSPRTWRTCCRGLTRRVALRDR